MGQNSGRMWSKLGVLGLLFFSFIQYANCISGRIINGTLAGWEEASYTVSLRQREIDEYGMFGAGHICGGTLIMSDVAITAAHCFADRIHTLPGAADDLYAVVGLLNRFAVNDYTVFLGIAKIVPHEQFNSSTNANDIALVFLNGHIPSGHPVVRPIARNQVKLSHKTRCQVNGWGLMNEHGDYPSDLLKASLSTIDFNKCLELDPEYKNTLRRGMMCAGYERNKDGGICFQDSGGPLVCYKKLAGIASFGFSAKCNGPVTVYTEVAYYSSWIDGHINTELGGGKVESITSRLEGHFATIVFIVGNLVFWDLHI